jgi:hypothetical protein
MPEYRDRDTYLPAYQKYLERVPSNILKCRIYGHKFPDLDDELKKKNSRASVRRNRRGTIVIQIECGRRCGTYLTRFRTADGYRARSNRIYREDDRKEYDYDNPGYLLPPEARSGHGLTVEMNAMARAEEMERLSDWITDDFEDPTEEGP